MGRKGGSPLCGRYQTDFSGLLWTPVFKLAVYLVLTTCISHTCSLTRSHNK